jgi:hypothetical protein
VLATKKTRKRIECAKSARPEGSALPDTNYQRPPPEARVYPSIRPTSVHLCLKPVLRPRIERQERRVTCAVFHDAGNNWPVRPLLVFSRRVIGWRRVSARDLSSQASSSRTRSESSGVLVGTVQGRPRTAAKCLRAVTGAASGRERFARSLPPPSRSRPHSVTGAFLSKPVFRGNTAAHGRRPRQHTCYEGRLFGLPFKKLRAELASATDPASSTGGSPHASCRTQAIFVVGRRPG